MFAATSSAQQTSEPSTAPLSTTPRTELPEGPTTIVEADLQPGVGSQGSAVAGGTEVLTAGFTPSTLASTASSVTVITEEQIRQRGQTSVAEVLRGVPGVDVVRQSAPGSVTTVFIRGAAGENTKVLIDNVPVNDPISPARAFDFANLSVDNIERIEIIRGPQSVLYGSDALGGVINIITKKGQGRMTGRVAALGGSFSTFNTAANASGSTGPVYYSLGGSYFDTNGFSAARRGLPGNFERDGFQLGTLSARSGWQPSQNLNVDFVLRYNQSLVDIDKGGGPFQDDPNDSNTLQQTVGGVRIHAVGPREYVETTVAYYVSDVLRGIRSPADPGGLPINFTGLFQGNVQQIDFRNTVHLLDNDWVGYDVTFGGLYQTEVGASQTVFDFFGVPFPSAFPRTSLDDGAVYGQNQLRLGDNWITTVGIRSDHYNAYGANDTYRATTLYRLPGLNTTFRGTIGTAFRAPSLFQRFDPFSGNPALLPEHSKGWDVGLEQPLFDGDLVPSVTYFRNDFINFIDFSQNNFQYFNVPNTRTDGIEFNTLFVLDQRTTLTTSYTFMNTHGQSNSTPPALGTDAPLRLRPQNKFGMQLNRGFFNGRGNWNAGLLYVGHRNDAVGFPSTTVRLADYVLVNTAMSYDVSRRVQLFGRVDNVFNEKYEEVSGFGTARRSAFAGAALIW